MLKLKYLFENYDLAKYALKYWEHDVDTLDEMLSHFRISSNAVYPFKQNGKVCFLRLAPTQEKQKNNIFGEMEFISYLSEHDYPGNVPIKSVTGETCIKLMTSWGEYYATAFESAKGVQLEKTDKSDEIMYQYGKALGKLHSLSSQFAPKIKKWTYLNVLDWIELVLHEYNAPDDILQKLTSLKQELGKVSINNSNYGLIHYDFELDNVFYDKDTNTCSVIDFDDGMYHWYALDIEQVFNSLEEELKGESLKNAKDQFISGYKSEHCFTLEMDNSRALMRRFINLYSYARLIRCIAEKFENEPEWMIQLRLKLNKVIEEKMNAL